MGLLCQPYTIYFTVYRQVVYTFYIVQTPPLFPCIHMVGTSTLDIMSVREKANEAERMVRRSVQVVVIFASV